MTATTIVMPYVGTDRFRVALWVRQRYETLHPHWRLVVAVDGGRPWSKARAANRGVPPGADIIIVSDADVAVPAKALEWAVATVADGAAWAVPYGMVYRLHEGTTAEVLHQAPGIEVEPVADAACVAHRPPYPAVAGGGILVVARDAWETIGGFDERFEWGQEDAPLGHALDTLAGPHEQLPAPLWHLWHVPRTQSPQMYTDHALEARYLAAHGHPEAMRRLIREQTTGTPGVVPHTGVEPV